MSEKNLNDSPTDSPDILLGIEDRIQEIKDGIEIDEDSSSINYSSLRDELIARIKFFIKYPPKKCCEAYDISERKYRSVKQSMVIHYGIDPRLLYAPHVIKQYPILMNYMDDEKLFLPIEKQFIDKDSVTKNGFLTKRKTIQYDRNGDVINTWEKSELDQESLTQQVKLVIEDLCKSAKPAPTIAPPKITEEDIMTFYPLPDIHFGMLVCKDEVSHGLNFDLKIAEDWVKTSFKYLVDSAPKSKTCVIADLGDFLHSADDSNRTKSGNILDVDQRHSKIVRIAFEALRMLILAALKKHETVYFYSVPGNHSDNISIYLKAYLNAWFRADKRVVVMESNKMQQYHVFGKCILGFSHGHTLKPEKADSVLIADNMSVVSDSLYRYFHFGHFHTDKSFSTPLCKIEVHTNLPPTDHWADSMGYRGLIGLAKAIVYHKLYGELSRNTFNIMMATHEKETGVLMSS